jgi:DNA-binding MurR/RpiR family transcriptional regulator
LPGWRPEAVPSSLSQDPAALGYTKPESYEELRAVLSSGTVRLPKKLRQVAIYLWQHPSEVALGTVTSIAREAGVQPSTMVRFAQTFGYAGFSDFQAVFKAHVKGEWMAGKDGAAPGSEAASLVTGFVHSSITSLSRVKDRLDTASFERVAASLASADIIYIVGSKRAFSVTSYISLALSKLGVRNILVDNVGSGAFELIGCATARDAVLAVSFTPYNSVTPDLTASAAQRGTAVVAITDSAFSPLVPLSRAYIEVVEEDFAGFKSLAATLAVAMAVVMLTVKLRAKGESEGD